MKHRDCVLRKATRQGNTFPSYKRSERVHLKQEDQK